jgi:hypothetical protein
VKSIGVLILFFSIVGYSQSTYTSDEALKLQKQLIDSAGIYKYTSETHKYITYNFRALELMPYIKNNHEHKLIFHALFALRLNQLGLINESIKQSNEFLNYYKNYESEFSPELKELLFGHTAFNYNLLAENYLKVNKPDSTAFIYKKSIEFNAPHVSKYTVSSINNYGLFHYHTLKNLDSALYYFYMAKDFADKHAIKEHIYGSVIDNIADIYFETNRVEDASELYKKNYAFYKITPHDENDFLPIDYNRLISAGSQYVESELILGNIESAEEVLNNMPNYFNPLLDPNSIIEYLSAKEKFHLSKNEHTRAYETLHKKNQLKDSIIGAEIESKAKLYDTFNEIVLDRIRASLVMERQQLEEYSRRQKLRFWIVVLTMSLVLFFLFYLYQRRKQYLLIAEQKSKNIELQNLQLNNEINLKKRDLSDFAINLSQSNEWAKDLYKQLELIKRSKGRSRKKLFDEFDQEIKNKIAFDNETEKFYNKLDLLNADFYEKLKQNFPDLTNNELRLCSLIRLKIDSHEIATLQNITVSSLNTARYRLRKKINLSENTDLNDFIQSL